MRNLLLLLLLIAVFSVKAQTALNDTTQGLFTDTNKHILANNGLEKKWSLSSFKGINTSYLFIRGGNAMMVSAPMGIQLNRKLDNNFYAFAGVSAMPAYLNFNNTFLNTNANKFQPGGMYKGNTLGIYGRAQMGLMYINDAKTFSISGSFSVQRGSNPYLLQPLNTPGVNGFIQPNR